MNKVMENKNSLIKFKFGEKEYTITSPTSKILRESRFKSSKVFTEAIREGFYTRRKLEILFKEENTEISILTAHAQKKEELFKLIADVTKEAEEETDANRLDYLATLLKFYREALIQEDLSLNNLFNNTAEQMAEEERINFLTYSLIREESGAKLWESYDAFLDDSQFELVEHCKYQVLCWDMRLDPNWEKELPEAKYTKKAEDIRKEEENKKSMALSKEEVIKPTEPDLEVVPIKEVEPEVKRKKRGPKVSKQVDKK